jgi:adenylate kinase
MAESNLEERRDLQKLWRENLWLRDILTRAAEDLERLANQREGTEAVRRMLQRRALRMLRISVIVNALIGIVNAPIGDREHGRGPAVL